jgi:hypothetical protein
MPNNSSARRNKEEKRNRQRGSTPNENQVPAESVESFLSRSSTDSGFQGDDDEVIWESAAGEAALDNNSLSSFHRVTSSAEPMETRKERKRRERKEALEKEVNEEPDISLSDDDRQKNVPASRKTSLSPTQFLESKALGPLTGSIGMRQRAMERLSARTAPIQVSEAKGKEAAVDVPVEAVACEVASGVNTTQQDNQGIPQGSPSVSFPSPTFQHASNRACASASSQSCSRTDSCWIWMISSPSSQD